jgi:predicted Na+-dependent transporter
MASRVRSLVAGYPELALILVAAACGLVWQPPLAWLAGHQGINAVLVALVFATAVTIEPAAIGRIAGAWRSLAAALLAGITALPALSWAVARIVPDGPLRDGVLTLGLAPCEIASVATTAMAGGDVALSAGVLIGSTVITVLFAGPLLRLEASGPGGANVSPAGIIVSLALVVALPLAAGMTLRWRVRSAARLSKPAAATAMIMVALLVALIAAEVRLSARYWTVAAALAAFLAGSAVLGWLLGWLSGSLPGWPPHSPPGSLPHSLPHSPPGSPPHSPPGSPPHSPPGSPPHSPPGSPPHSPPGSPPRSPPGWLPGSLPHSPRRIRPGRPARAALLLTTSMRDFAIAAGLAAAAFGTGAAAPLGLYGILVLAWGTAAAGFLRRRGLRR